jgi:hypothetical protein
VPPGGADSNPYVGVRPFPPDRRIYGRDQELLVLTNRLLSDRLILMFSPSGAGKTSMIMARGGLRDRMRAEGFRLLEPIRVGLTADVAARTGVNRYLLSTLVSLERGRSDSGRDDEALARMIAAARGAPADRTHNPTPPADFLHHQIAALSAPPGPGVADPVLLVFDQFEELLTLDPTDGGVKRDYIRQLGVALRDTDRWALFAMREDYIAALGPYLPLFPTRLAATFRLDLLEKKSAREAAQRPAAEHTVPVTFEDDAARHLVDELARIKVQDPLTGKSEPKDGSYVEPLHLQVVCQRLWKERLSPDRITTADLDRLTHGAGEGLHGVTAALAAYFDEVVRETAARFAPAGVTEKGIRNWFGACAISPSGFRLPVLLGTEAEYNLNPAVLNELALRYLIRSEHRHGQIFYELTHDRLVEPILKSNAAWLWAEGRRRRWWIRAAIFVGAAAALAAVVAGFSAKNAEFNRMTALVRGIDVECRQTDWSEEQLARIENKLDQLQALDPQIAAQKRTDVGEAFAAAIRANIRAPVTSPEGVAAIRAQLTRLHPYAPDRESELRRELMNLTEWKPIPELTLTAPFSSAQTAFGPNQVRVEGTKLIRDGENVIARTTVRSSGRIRLEVDFDPSWKNAAAVGLVTNSTDAHRYLFVVSVPEFDPGDPGGRAKLGGVLGPGERARIAIYRDSVPLAGAAIQLDGGRGLTLRVELAGDRLSLETPGEGQKLMVVDPFPLVGGAIGLYWPSGVGVSRVGGSQQSLHLPPNNLEEGDALYAGGEYAAALTKYEARYEEARRQGAGGGPDGQATRYKMAMCRKQLQQGAEANALFEQLRAELPPNPDEVLARWPVLAAAQLWKSDLDDGRREAAVGRADELGRSYSAQFLCGTIPLGDRRGVIDSAADLALANEARWQLAYRTEKTIAQIQRAVRVLEHLCESTSDRHAARRRLADGYRIFGRPELAVRELEALCNDPNLPLDEQVTFTRDLVWVLLAESTDPAENRLRRAAVLIDDLWSRAGTGEQQRQLVLPLQIDAARLRAAGGDWKGAEERLETYAQQVIKSSLSTNYGDFAEACLLRGFVREALGDRAGAQDAWRKGLLSNWPRGALPLPPRRRTPGWLEINNRDNTLLYAVVIASLLDNLSDTDADEVYKNIIRAFGAFGTAAKVAIENTFSVKFVQKVFREVSRTEDGRKLARKLALRQLGLRDTLLEPQQLLLLEGFRYGAFDGAIPPELASIVRKQCTDLATAYGDGRLGDEEAASLVRLWRGEQDDPAPDWAVVRAAGVPELHVPLAYTFGRRYTQLKRDALARPFYQYVVDQAKPTDTVLARLARQELDRIK